MYQGTPAFIWKGRQLGVWSKAPEPQILLHHRSASPSDHPAENKQVNLCQSKKLLHSKGNHQQNGKITYEMEENLYKSHT